MAEVEPMSLAGIDPTLVALLHSLPAPGQPFPTRVPWLRAFGAVVDYLYPEEGEAVAEEARQPSPQPPAAKPPSLAAWWYTCPQCGGPKSRYAKHCRKHNRGREGNRGGQIAGGNRHTPEVKAALEGDQPVEVKPTEMSPEDRKDLAAALKSKSSPGKVVAIVQRAGGEHSPRHHMFPDRYPRHEPLDRCPECKKIAKPISQPRCDVCEQRKLDA